jgi:hypothetical protein
MLTIDPKLQEKLLSGESAVLLAPLFPRLLLCPEGLFCFSRLVCQCVVGGRLSLECGLFAWRELPSREEGIPLRGAGLRVEARLEKLERQVASWNRARQIREYAKAMRQWAEERHGGLDPGSELGKWIVWALGQADRFDPLR